MATARITVGPNQLSHQLTQRGINTQKLLEAAQLEAAQRTLRKVSKDSPVDMGLYKAAWSVRQSIQDRTVQLGNDAPYAGVIERGARPFRPPFKPLFEWAQRKAGDLALGGLLKIGSNAFRITKAGNLNYKGKKSLDEDDLDAIRSFTFAVIRKIEKVGLKPKRIMGKNLPFAAKALKRAVDAAIHGDLGKKF